MPARRLRVSRCQVNRSMAVRCENARVVRLGQVVQVGQALVAGREDIEARYKTSDGRGAPSSNLPAECPVDREHVGIRAHPFGDAGNDP